MGDATLSDLLLHFLTSWMQRWEIFCRNFQHPECYVVRSFLALFNIPPIFCCNFFSSAFLRRWRPENPKILEGTVFQCRALKTFGLVKPRPNATMGIQIPGNFYLNFYHEMTTALWDQAHFIPKTEQPLARLSPLWDVCDQLEFAYFSTGSNQCWL